ncbi:MAG TPA: hypothetical protein VGL09_06860 [Methylomirabilota bacterium]
MELLVGLLTAVVGIGFIAAPWVLRLTANTLASSAVIAGGLIITLYGLGLVREAFRKFHPRPRH